MTKIIIIVGFLVAFGAGLVVGVGTHRVAPADPKSKPEGPGGGPGWLTRELKLSPDQQDKMKQIWQDVAHRGGREQDDRRAQLRKERDEAIAALIRPEDLAAYDQVLKNYSDQLAQLDKEWRDAFDTAVTNTEKILTPEQLTKYQEIRKQRQPWERPPRGGGGGGPGGPGGPHGGPRGGGGERNHDFNSGPTSRPGNGM
jgi:Spy/CpxP family protein refolding chaperone